MPRMLCFSLFWAFILPFLVTACSVEDSGSTDDEASDDLVVGNDIVEINTLWGDLPEMRERRFIRALVVYSQTDFFLEDGHKKGIQAEYLKGFEKYLNKDIKKEADKTHIKIMPVPFNQLIPMIESGKGDIAAHFLTITPEREKQVDFATGRQLKVNEVIVAHKSVKGIRSLDDLAGREVYVLSGSSYYEHLSALSASLQGRGLAPINLIQADPRLRSEDILELVNAGVEPLTVVDDYLANLWRKVLKDIRVLEKIPVTSERYIGWAVRQDSPKLRQALVDYSKKARKGTKLGNILINRYYGSERWIANPDDKESRDRLNRYLPLFEKYAKQYNHDPMALAAQAYHESGLNHKRKSRAGAVGLMQLLPRTAADRNVNIPDISSEENNIHAGAKYMAFLRDRYFSDEDIVPVDRMAFTWAAYNVGPARVQVLRKEAERMGLDPDVWFSNVELAAGKLVGTEPVRYVAKIYKYYLAYDLVRQRREEKQKVLDKRLSG